MTREQAILDQVCGQRNEALNQVAMLAGELADVRTKLEAAEAKIKELEKPPSDPPTE